MRPILSAALLLIALQAPTPQGDPDPAPAPAGHSPAIVISGPTDVMLGNSIVLDASGSYSQKPIRWSVTPKVPLLKLTDEDTGLKGAIVLVPNPPVGTYHFKAVAVVLSGPDGQPDADAGVWDVTVTVPIPPAPPVPPGPTPDPEPTPTPVVSGKLFATVILDADATSPAYSAAGTSVGFRAALPGLNATFHRYLSNQPEVAAKRLDGPAGKVGYPALIVQDSAGHVILQERYTNDFRITDALKKFRGTP